MNPEHRSALLSLASRRGEKGFSSVLGEAIEMYLRAETERNKRRQAVRSLAGSLSRKDAGLLHRKVRDLRENWR